MRIFFSVIAVVAAISLGVFVVFYAQLAPSDNRLWVPFSLFAVFGFANGLRALIFQKKISPSIEYGLGLVFLSLAFGAIAAYMRFELSFMHPACILLDGIAIILLVVSLVKQRKGSCATFLEDAEKE